MQHSVALRNNILEAMELTFAGQTLNAGSGSGASVTGTAAAPRFRIDTGTMPANCAAARTGTTLGNIACPADFFAAAASGVKALNGTWQVAAAASGLGGYYSIMDNAGTTCHEQGLVSQPHAVSTAYLLNQQVHVGSNVYRCTTAGTSGAASPPSGTGSGIADGTAVWAYVGVKGVELDNSNITSGQTITITAKTVTAPGA